MTQVLEFLSTFSHIYVAACVLIWLVWLIFDRSHKHGVDYLLMFVLLLLMLLIGWGIIHWFGW